jgi:hypothetical protein
MIGEIRNIVGSLLVAGFTFSAYGQGAVDINGVVNDSKSGNPVAGAKVALAMNPDINTMTDNDGKFHLTGTATVGVRSGAAAKVPMAFKGSRLDFYVAADNTPVSVAVYDFTGEKVLSLAQTRASRGNWSVNAAPAGLARGIYFVRARVGTASAAFRMSTLGGSGKTGLVPAGSVAMAALAKAADAVDSIIVTKDGYHTLSKPLLKYTSALLQLTFAPKLPTGDLKIVSERGIPQVEWGSNVDVQVWDGGTQLKGDYKTAPAEGTQSWMVTFSDAQAYNAWGFVTTKAPEDMSAWKNGHMHLSVRGTVNSIGVTMASADQPSGMSKKVDLRDYGYKPLTADSKPTDWITVSVPMSAFEGVDFSQISVYVGLVAPVEADTEPFDPTTFYQVDDIWWSVN